MKVTVAAAAFAALAATSAHAHTVVVGNCIAGATSLPTIGQAIAAVGNNGTVKICPGLYPEQLSITKNVKLIGVASGNASEAAIVSPAGGLQVNATDPDSGLPVAAQVIATGGATVSISNLTIDAANNNVASCAVDVIGLYYLDAGGTITGNVVRNQYETDFADYGGCQSGLGIYVQGNAGGAIVSITKNVVEKYQKNGITGNDSGANVTITGNTVLGMGPTNGAAENSIQIAYGATGSVSGNVTGDDVWAPDQFGDTGDAAAGILVYASANVGITGNTVGGTQYGIVVVGDGNGDADGTTINNNMVNNTYLYDAIDICGAGGATVKGNGINGADESAVHVDGTCGGASPADTILNNKINGTCAGVLEGVGVATPGLGSNTILNAANLTLAGSDVCPVSQSTQRKPGHGKARHARPFR